MIQNSKAIFLTWNENGAIEPDLVQTGGIRHHNWQLSERSGPRNLLADLV